MKKTTIILYAATMLLFITSYLWADVSNPLTGTYYGTANITSPAHLGTIDLVIYMDVTGETIQHDSSYIVLEKTLLFPAAPPQIDGKDVGPRVNGTLNPIFFSLSTDSFSSTVKLKEYDITQHRDIDKTINVTRRVVLGNATAANNGNSLSGTYTETIAGMDRDDVIVTGTFILVKPVVAASAGIKDLNGDGCLDLSEITAGGNNSGVVEFTDVSYALNLFNNPAVQPNICSPGNQIMEQALKAYHDSLQ